MLKRLLICLAAVLTLTSAALAQKHGGVQPFPANGDPVGGAYDGGGGLSLKTSCAVTFDKTSGMYAYTIALDYKSDKERLLSWNALDWVLSQYPNAVGLGHSNAHLFPLQVGKGDYTFRFQTKDRPMSVERTAIRTFARDLPSAEKRASNKEIAGWSGVAVSSYGYLQQEVGLYFPMCLPEPLLIFLK